MLLNRIQKEDLVLQMGKNLKASNAVVFVNFSTMKVKEVQELKKTLKQKGIGFQVIKNSLFKIALKKANIAIEENIFDQPIAIIWGLEDEIEPAKLTVQFSKTCPALEIVGGIINQTYTEQETVRQLAALPSRAELYAKTVGSLKAPLWQLVNVLQGNLRSLVYLLKQYQQLKNN